MKTAIKGIVSIGLVSVMMTVTAFAGTFVPHNFPPVTFTEKGDDNYERNIRNSLKTYTGFVDDRSQATLIETDWMYLKDDGSYAVSEWVEDETGKYYIYDDGYTIQNSLTLDGNIYFFEPSDAHLVTDAIVEVNAVSIWDIGYTINEDGTWDLVPIDGFNLSDLQRDSFLYFGEDGALVTDGAIPGGLAANHEVQNAVKGLDENGIPYLTVGDVRYVATKSSSWDRTYETAGDGGWYLGAEHEFYTVYVRVK